MTLQEKVERVRDFRLIDDVFFEVFAEDIPACQEILRTILEDDKLTVHEVTVQSSKKNLYGRSVRLDALCTLGDGSKANIEVQRSDNDDHLRRARFNASVITARDSEPGDRFEDIPELYIIYISESDFLKDGLTVYHVDKTVRENGRVLDDGLHEIFVNTAVKDGSTISDLMTYFVSENVDAPEFPEVTRKFRDLKSEGGAPAVCEIMERYMEEARTEGMEKGREENVRNVIRNLLSMNLPTDQIAKAVSMKEEELKKYLLQLEIH